MTKEPRDHISIHSIFPEAGGASSHTLTALHPKRVHPAPAVLNSFRDKPNEKRRGRRGSAGAKRVAEGVQLGGRVPGLPAPTAARTGAAAAGSRPAGQAAAREPGAASWAPPAPAGSLGRASLQRGCGRLGRGREWGARRSTRTWIELISIPPAVQSLGPAPTSPLSPNTGSQAPVRGGLPGLRWRRLWAPGSLPCRQPGRLALLLFLPPSPVRSREAG